MDPLLMPCKIVKSSTNLETPRVMNGELTLPLAPSLVLSKQLELTNTGHI